MSSAGAEDDSGLNSRGTDQDELIPSEPPAMGPVIVRTRLSSRSHSMDRMEIDRLQMELLRKDEAIQALNQLLDECQRRATEQAELIENAVAHSNEKERCYTAEIERLKSMVDARTEEIAQLQTAYQQLDNRGTAIAKDRPLHYDYLNAVLKERDHLVDQLHDVSASLKETKALLANAEFEKEKLQMELRDSKRKCTSILSSKSHLSGEFQMDDLAFLAMATPNNRHSLPATLSFPPNISPPSPTTKCRCFESDNTFQSPVVAPMASEDTEAPSLKSCCADGARADETSSKTDRSDRFFRNIATLKQTHLLPKLALRHSNSSLATSALTRTLSDRERSSDEQSRKELYLREELIRAQERIAELEAQLA